MSSQPTTSPLHSPQELAAAEMEREFLRAEARDRCARRVSSAQSLGQGDGALHNLKFDQQRTDRLSVDALLRLLAQREGLIERAIVQQLAMHGWILLHSSPLAVGKEYDTAVGKKAAVVRIVRRAQDFSLEGEYQSEGKNVLSTAGILHPIPKTYTGVQVQERVTAFAKEVDATVAGTYAARLLARGVDHRNGIGAAAARVPDCAHTALQAQDEPRDRGDAYRGG